MEPTHEKNITCIGTHLHWEVVVAMGLFDGSGIRNRTTRSSTKRSSCFKNTNQCESNQTQLPFHFHFRKNSPSIHGHAIWPHINSRVPFDHHIIITLFSQFERTLMIRRRAFRLATLCALRTECDSLWCGADYRNFFENCRAGQITFMRFNRSPIHSSVPCCQKVALLCVDKTFIITA